MKILFGTVFIFFFNISYAQNTVSNIIAKNVCNCLRNKLSQGTLIYKDAVNCINFENEAQSELYINEAVQKYGDSPTSSQAIQYAKDVGLNVSLNLIDSCSSYRELMDTARYSLYSYLDKDSLLTEISKLNLADTSNRKLNFYTKRAKMLFWISNIKEAAQDARQILKIDSTNQLGLHISAMQFELNHDYESALNIYTALYKTSNNPRYAIDAAIAKWKIKYKQ